MSSDAVTGPLEDAKSTPGGEVLSDDKIVRGPQTSSGSSSSSRERVRNADYQAPPMHRVRNGGGGNHFLAFEQAVRVVP